MAPIFLTCVLAKVAEFVGDDDYLHLGPILRSGRVGRDIVHGNSVLISAHIYKIFHDPRNIFKESVYRPFFKKCLAAGNSDAVYYEALRLAAVESNIKGAIDLLDTQILTYENATLTSAFFCVCAGKRDKVAHHFRLYRECFAPHGSPQQRDTAYILLCKLSWYFPPKARTFDRLFHFPNFTNLPWPKYATYCYVNRRQPCK